MNCKIVCYTALVGPYDDLKSPSYVSPDWDYVCFTDQPFGDQVGVWKIRPLEKVIENDPTRTNRWHKMHPHILFPDHDISVYLDSNIEIIGAHLKTKLKDLFHGVNLIALPVHPFRDCVYDEIDACIGCRSDRLSLLQANAHVLRKSSYPEKNGLYENNLIIRKHNDPLLITLTLEWWDMLYRYSKRDQLSLVYLLWKYKIHVEEILPQGQTIRSHSDYKYTPHLVISEKVKPTRNRLFARLITSFIPVAKWRRYLRNKLKEDRDTVKHSIR